MAWEETKAFMVMTLSLRNACDGKKANRKRKTDKNRVRDKGTWWRRRRRK